MIRGCGIDSDAMARVTSGRSVGMHQEIQPPRPWPMTTASFSPSARMTLAASSVAMYVS
jgi:hypothetical protein